MLVRYATCLMLGALVVGACRKKNDQVGVGHRECMADGNALTEAACAPNTPEPGRFFTGCAEIEEYLSYAKNLPPLMGDQTSVSERRDAAYVLPQKEVRETDVVLVATHHIFVQRASDIVVIDRALKTELGTIDLAKAISTNIYVSNKVLAVASSQLNTSTLDIYALAEAKMPEHRKSFAFDGYLRESRLMEHYLVLVTQTYRTDELVDADAEYLHFSSGNPASEDVAVRCDRVLTPPDVRQPASFAFSHSLNLADFNDDVESLGLALADGLFYATDDALFFTKPVFSGAVLCVDSIADGCSCRGTNAETHLTKLSFDPKSGALDFVATGVVPGEVKVKGALKAAKKSDVLFVTATIGAGASPSGHYLYSIAAQGKDLTVKASIDAFGKSEAIKAINYAGDMVYVASMGDNSPLFVIDLSNPLQPALRTTLKVGGFSESIYELAGELLFGVGIDAKDAEAYAGGTGLQLSLFDASKKDKPKRLSVESIGFRGSYSEAIADPHAFYYDQDNARIGVPLVEFGTAHQHSDEASDFKFSGAIFYLLDQGALVEEKRVSHSDLIPVACRDELEDENLDWWQAYKPRMDIRRIFSLKNEVYTISPFGMRIYSADLSTVVATLAFAKPAKTCASLLHARLSTD